MARPHIEPFVDRDVSAKGKDSGQPAEDKAA